MRRMATGELRLRQSDVGPLPSCRNALYAHRTIYPALGVFLVARNGNFRRRHLTVRGPRSKRYAVEVDCYSHSHLVTSRRAWLWNGIIRAITFLGLLIGEYLFIPCRGFGSGLGSICRTRDCGSSRPPLLGSTFRRSGTRTVASLRTILGHCRHCVWVVRFRSSKLMSAVWYR